MGHGSEPGRVGLHQETIRRHLRRHRSERRRVFKGHDAGEAHVVAKSNRFLGHFPAFRKTVQHPGFRPGPGGAQMGQGVLPSLPGVNDHGQPMLGAQGQMLRKASPLQGPIGGGGIGVIQPRFPESDHAQRPRSSDHGGPGGRISGDRQGMNPHAAIYPLCALNHSQHAIKVLRIGAHAQQVPHPRLFRPGDAHLRGRLQIVEMAVAIHQHERTPESKGAKACRWGARRP